MAKSGKILAGLWAIRLGIQTTDRTKSFQSLVFALTQLHLVQWSNFPFSICNYNWQIVHILLLAGDLLSMLLIDFEIKWKNSVGVESTLNAYEQVLEIKICILTSRFCRWTPCLVMWNWTFPFLCCSCFLRLYEDQAGKATSLSTMSQLATAEVCRNL